MYQDHLKKVESLDKLKESQPRPLKCGRKIQQINKLQEL